MIGDIAHVFNRGVEKRKIFLDQHDYVRFVENLVLLNNVSGKIRTRSKNIFKEKLDLSKQKKLVEILNWSLLPNHYHLLLYEVEEGGIIEFAKRLGNAYTKYFNTRRKGRSGYLFQNSAKIVPILNDSQFLYIPVYVTLNPLDLKFPGWEHASVKDPQLALDFLKKYEWSSFKDFMQIGQRDIVINRKLFYEMFFKDQKTYQKELLSFLNNSPVSTWQVDTGWKELLGD